MPRWSRAARPFSVTLDPSLRQALGFPLFSRLKVKEGAKDEGVATPPAPAPASSARASGGGAASGPADEGGPRLDEEARAAAFSFFVLHLRGLMDTLAQWLARLLDSAALYKDYSKKHRPAALSGAKDSGRVGRFSVSHAFVAVDPRRQPEPAPAFQLLLPVLAERWRFAVRVYLCDQHVCLDLFALDASCNSALLPLAGSETPRTPHPRALDITLPSDPSDPRFPADATNSVGAGASAAAALPSEPAGENAGARMPSVKGESEAGATAAARRARGVQALLPSLSQLAAFTHDFHVYRYVSRTHANTHTHTHTHTHKQTYINIHTYIHTRDSYTDTCWALPVGVMLALRSR